MSEFSDVCLVVVFNHRHEANLPVLEKLYRPRFPRIRYLMPFYAGVNTDVIPVHHSSYTFQGYFAEAFTRLSEPEYEFYVFVADDLLLSPDLNSKNLAHEFSLQSDGAYIKELTPLEKAPVGWPHRLPALRSFKPNSFVSFHDSLPCLAEVVERWRSLGLGAPSTPSGWLLLRDLTSKPSSRPAVWLDNALYWIQQQTLSHRRALHFPLLTAYSDLVIVPATALPRFCSLCGLFAAMNLFVEVAIPTALALSADHIITEKSISRKGREIWDRVELKQWLGDHDRRLDRIVEMWPANCLYVHPVKFSQLFT